MTYRGRDHESIHALISEVFANEVRDGQYIPTNHRIDVSAALNELQVAQTLDDKLAVMEKWTRAVWSPRAKGSASDKAPIHARAAARFLGELVLLKVRRPIVFLWDEDDEDASEREANEAADEVCLHVLNAAFFYMAMLMRLARPVNARDGELIFWADQWLRLSPLQCKMLAFMRDREEAPVDGFARACWPNVRYYKSARTRIDKALSELNEKLLNLKPPITKTLRVRDDKIFVCH